MKTLVKGTIHQVKVPLPFPLRWVNSYLLAGDDGVTVIDPGLHTPASEELWEKELREAGLGFSDISSIVLTHHHPDHYGLAGWFQERTGAPVRLSPEGLRQARLLWGRGEPLTAAIRDLFARHGMPEELLNELTVHMEGFLPQISPQPDVTVLEEGERLRMGGRDWDIIETGGHASGHLSFYDPETLAMICGDHVIPQISPNVSYIPGIDENPLATYLKDLRRVSGFEVEKAYPGHREPFTGFSRRALDLVVHHEERLDRMAGALTGEPLTAYELCIAFFGSRLSIHQLRFAMAETLAHLFFLAADGRVKEEETASGILYRHHG
ncbi:MBL fold metallo-hydrolase [Paenibacillus aurantius]|uniref:MBL fold metallo-hydrolase n=1 Tax=Paenibacillus aurantius TaxID=2918900 RepID=A0AA96LFP2_9BACL|nr:MBL fold metallo-hydrolase [Paenibacillus aurantius]WNQ12921.1 MBL fold metallo-hydrolase [Paenibacillus aurantius]